MMPATNPCGLWFLFICGRLHHGCLVNGYIQLVLIEVVRGLIEEENVGVFAGIEGYAISDSHL